MCDSRSIPAGLPTHGGMKLPSWAHTSGCFCRTDRIASESLLFRLSSVWTIANQLNYQPVVRRHHHAGMIIQHDHPVVGDERWRCDTDVHRIRERRDSKLANRQFPPLPLEVTEQQISDCGRREQQPNSPVIPVPRSCRTGDPGKPRGSNRFYWIQRSRESDAIGYEAAPASGALFVMED